jgi:acetyl-CoA carboxylase biotin carboxyl carrier protein
VLVAGEDAGEIGTLGVHIRLVVPADSGGRIVSNPPDRTRAPVAYADVLYELALDVTPAVASAPAEHSPADAEGVLRSPQSGRFYHRPAPGEPAFAAEGAIVADGNPIGLIEVMKTFSHVPYRAGGGLPARARFVRYVARDGGDVRAGDALAELAPAEGT